MLWNMLRDMQLLKLMNFKEFPNKIIMFMSDLPDI